MLNLASAIQEGMNVYARESRGLVANPPEELKEKFESNRDQAFQNVNVAIESLRKFDIGEKSQDLIQKLETLSKTYNEMNRQIDVLIKEGKNEEVT
jgi:two-component system chemotaxis sensor kinase CheA